jgi:hypothetical protein
MDIKKFIQSMVCSHPNKKNIILAFKIIIGPITFKQRLSYTSNWFYFSFLLIFLVCFLSMVSVNSSSYSPLAVVVV